MELVAYKRRFAGLLLTGILIEILFILHGGGNNGKSTEMETIAALLGDYAHAAAASLLTSASKNSEGATPGIVALKGKRAVFINETSQSDRLNEARVKYLTGNDTMSGRDLYEKVLNFIPTHKPILRTNHRPAIRGTDLGMWRRIHYIPYTVTITDDEDVKDFRETVLIPELPGILNWALAGLQEFLANGKKLKPPPIVQKATKEYRAEMNTAGQWIDAACERVKENPAQSRCTLTQLQEAYAAWCEDEHGPDTAMDRRELAAQLRERGFKDGTAGNRVVFYGIALKATGF